MREYWNTIWKCNLNAANVCVCVCIADKRGILIARLFHMRTYKTRLLEISFKIYRENIDPW